jgi:hypothetical protein
MCKTENVLCEVGLPTLTEIRDEKNDEDRIKDIDERKPPYQITNDKPEHLRRLCNETRITKTFLHTSGRIFGQMDIDERKVEKTPDYIRPPWYTDDGKNLDWSLCKMGKGTPNQTKYSAPNSKNSVNN